MHLPLQVNKRYLLKWCAVIKRDVGRCIGKTFIEMKLLIEFKEVVMSQLNQNKILRGNCGTGTAEIGVSDVEVYYTMYLYIVYLYM